MNHYNLIREVQLIQHLASPFQRAVRFSDEAGCDEANGEHDVGASDGAFLPRSHGNGARESGA